MAKLELALALPPGSPMEEIYKLILPPAIYARRWKDGFAGQSEIYWDCYEEALRLRREKSLSRTSGGKSGSDGPDESAGRWYLITFTRPSDERDPHDVLECARKVVRSKQVNALMWAMCLELTQAGAPHVHIVLFSEKYFDYKKIGNFNRGFKYDVQYEKYDVKKYIVKTDTKPPAEYLAHYGLTHFVWYSDNYSGLRYGSTDETSENDVNLLSLA